MNLKALKILAAFGGLAALVLFQDFLRFTLACRDYGRMAQTGLEQLSSKEIQSEALVVITGDRNRISKALELLQNQPHTWLLISGVSKKASLPELAVLHAEPLKLNPSQLDRIVLDSNATSTVENAQETEKILQEKGAQSMILITSDYHMLRALNVFKKWVNAKIIPFAVGSEMTGASFEQWPSFAFKFVVEYWKWVAFRFNIY